MEPQDLEHGRGGTVAPEFKVTVVPGTQLTAALLMMCKNRPLWNGCRTRVKVCIFTEWLWSQGTHTYILLKVYSSFQFHMYSVLVICIFIRICPFHLCYLGFFFVQSVLSIHLYILYMLYIYITHIMKNTGISWDIF